jgi:hypothetical protein
MSMKKRVDDFRNQILLGCIFEAINVIMWIILMTLFFRTVYISIGDDDDVIDVIKYGTLSIFDAVSQVESCKITV